MTEIKEKICVRCNETKSLENFSAEKRNKTDGKMSACKGCERERLRKFQIENRKNNPEEVRKYKRDYAREHSKRDGMKERISARKKLQYAVKSGKLLRPDRCERCSKNCKPQAHHPDHTKPLEVEWLCPLCHGIERQKNS